jgi:hypothetical protein
VTDRKPRLLRRLRKAGIHTRLAGCSGPVARVRAARLLAAVALATIPVAAHAEAFHQLPPGAPLPGATACADKALAAEQSWGEQRPDNAAQNLRTGSGTFGGHVDGTSSDARYGARVHGNSTTRAHAKLAATRELLSWGACKHGLSSDLTFARAVVESTWHMSTAGDNGHSHGLLQINDLYHLTTTPMSYERTPFSVDYALAWQRACVDGDFTWLGGDYASSTGDRRTWGCIGAWYSGNWQDGASQQYQGWVRTELAARRWEQQGF